MGEPYGNTVPVNLNENEPDGSQIKVRQLDDFQREERLALKTILERSMVPFGDPKAGEMKPGSAVMLVASRNLLNALESGSLENLAGRVAYASDDKQLYSWIDHGSGYEFTPIALSAVPTSAQAVVATSPIAQSIGTTYAYLNLAGGVTPMQINRVVPGADVGPDLTRISLGAQISIQNFSTPAKSVAFKFQMALDGGAYADLDAPPTALHSTPTSVRLANDTSAVVNLIGQVTLPHAPVVSRTYRFRIQAKADANGCQTGNGGFAGDPMQTIFWMIG